MEKELLWIHGKEEIIEGHFAGKDPILPKPCKLSPVISCPHSESKNSYPASLEWEFPSPNPQTPQAEDWWYLMRLPVLSRAISKWLGHPGSQLLEVIMRPASFNLFGDLIMTVLPACSPPDGLGGLQWSSFPLNQNPKVNKSLHISQLI